MTNFVILKIKSKPNGPRIDQGNWAIVHVFFQESLGGWKEAVQNFVDHYGYEAVEIVEGPDRFIDSADWSDFNRNKAIESESTGFPRFGTFHVFD